MDKIEEGIEEAVSYIRDVLQLNNKTVELLVEVLQVLDKRDYAKYSEKYKTLQKKAQILMENNRRIG